MVRKLDDYLVNLKDDIFFAHWKLHKNGAILLVLDEMVISRALLLSEN